MKTPIEQNPIDTGRRGFFKRSGAVAGAAVITATTLQTLTAHTAWAQQAQPILPGRGGRRSRSEGYGPLRPVKDQRGVEVLALPAGFTYVTFSYTGDPLADGVSVVPRNHDGMTVFKAKDGLLRLIRNHEVRNAPTQAPNAARFDTVGPAATRFDPLGNGGTMTLDFDPASMQLVRQFISVNGTIVNCSGGLSYKDTGWITCEETTAGPASNPPWTKPHGYCFFVPAEADETVPAIALPEMGRFAHEASVAGDDGTVYQTEDAGNTSGFYRFLPNDRKDLTRGGVLQMLAVRGAPQADLRTNQTVGTELTVEWVTITNPDPKLEQGEPRTFTQGFNQGGALFNRLEGVVRGDDDSIFFVSTSGGNARYGQLWRFIPGEDDGSEPDRLVLVFESPAGSVLDSPDNLIVSPSGGVLFCEDDASGGDNDTHPLTPGQRNIDRLIGLSRAGVPFEFAVSLLPTSGEFAGACFSPDGDILFVNLFGEGAAGTGMTCAIRGPWRSGPL
jgi:hypothetical protein